MSERLVKFALFSSLVLGFGLREHQLHAATLNPVVLPACPTQGVYQELDEAGIPHPSIIWYVPYRVGLDADAESVSVFSWQEGAEDWMSISLNLRLLPSDNARTCIKAAFPQHILKEIPTSRVSLQFLSNSSAYSAEVDGGENLDIFEKSQWIGLNLHGPGLHRNLGLAGESFSFRSFFRGVVLWELPYAIDGVRTLRQSLTFAQPDEIRLNTQVKEALHALLP